LCFVRPQEPTVLGNGPAVFRLGFAKTCNRPETIFITVRAPAKHQTNGRAPRPPGTSSKAPACSAPADGCELLGFFPRLTCPSHDCHPPLPVPLPPFVLTHSSLGRRPVSPPPSRFPFGNNPRPVHNPTSRFCSRSSACPMVFPPGFGRAGFRFFTGGHPLSPGERLSPMVRCKRPIPENPPHLPSTCCPGPELFRSPPVELGLEQAPHAPYGHERGPKLAQGTNSRPPTTAPKNNRWRAAPNDRPWGGPLAALRRPPPSWHNPPARADPGNRGQNRKSPTGPLYPAHGGRKNGPNKPLPPLPTAPRGRPTACPHEYEKIPTLVGPRHLNRTQVPPPMPKFAISAVPFPAPAPPVSAPVPGPSAATTIFGQRKPNLENFRRKGVISQGVDHRAGPRCFRYRPDIPIPRGWAGLRETVASPRPGCPFGEKPWAQGPSLAGGPNTSQARIESK